MSAMTSCAVWLICWDCARAGKVTSSVNHQRWRTELIRNTTTSQVFTMFSLSDVNICVKSLAAQAYIIFFSSWLVLGVAIRYTGHFQSRRARDLQPTFRISTSETTPDPELGIERYYEIIMTIIEAPFQINAGDNGFNYCSWILDLLASLCLFAGYKKIWLLNCIIGQLSIKLIIMPPDT